MEPENASAWWVGLDIAKQTFEVAVHPPWRAGMELPFSELRRRGFARTNEGIAELLEWLDGLGLEAEFRFIMEATGNYSTEAAVWLLAERPALTVVIADPKRVAHFIKSLGVRNKTDRSDAAALSRFGAERQPPPWEPPTPEYEELRQLGRHRTFIVGSLVAARNRLQEISGSAVVAAMHEKVVAGLQEALSQAEEAMRRHVAAHPGLREAVRLLDTIPGVSFITAATILGELGDLRRFRKSRSLSAFAGTSPRVFRSGTSVNRRARMSKQGGPRARQALYLAALSTIRGNNALARFYGALVAGGKSKMAAIGAVMRKMLVLMRALLVNGTVYQESASKEKMVFAT